MPVPTPLADTLDEAIGRRHRDDPVLGRSGGPAGNARLTAWTGALLLVLILAELVTTLNVDGLLDWHVALGAILVPVALLKTASTTWRMGRYYTGHGGYRTAGPPPTPLRLLGPLVVLSTLGLLGSGLALIALGPAAGHRQFMSVLGFGIAPLTVHQGMFIVFAVATGLHILARVVPAARMTIGRRFLAPGGARRGAVLALVALAAVLAAVLVVGADGPWQHGGFHRDGFRHGGTNAQR